jgi:1-acyl-sn-glycerol-3-phosphate acyltransferase
MKMASGIPVFPRSSGRTAEITEAAIDRVQNKRISILVFPEGHRTRDGQVQDFKRGVFFMARDAGIPIVPFAIRGFHEVNRAGNWLFHPFKPVEIYLGKQIETVGLSDDEVKELAAQTQKIIADFVERGELPERVTKSLDTNTRAKVAA